MTPSESFEPESCELEERLDSLTERSEQAVDSLASAVREASEQLLEGARATGNVALLDAVERHLETLHLVSVCAVNGVATALPADLSKARVLALSTAQSHDGRYLTYAPNAIKETLQGANEIVFVPFALADRDAYTAKVSKYFGEMGIAVRSVLDGEDPREMIRNAKAVFVGGGNTFRLMKDLHVTGILPLIRERVEDGMPYIGASAGSNVTMRNACTTNDMPIKEIAPASLAGLHLFPFNLNPHYPKEKPTPEVILRASPADMFVSESDGTSLGSLQDVLQQLEGEGHLGESRDKRISRFLEEQPEVPVLALEEGAGLSSINGELRIVGGRGFLFRAERERLELSEETDLTYLRQPLQ